MTKTEIMKKINECIGCDDKWFSMYYKGKEIGSIKMDDQYGHTKKEILEFFELREERDGDWTLWMENQFGNVCYSFDACRVEGY